MKYGLVVYMVVNVIKVLFITNKREVQKPLREP